MIHFRNILSVCLCLLTAALQAAEPNASTKPVPPKSLPFPGETFLVGDRPAFIMTPVRGLQEKNQPWIWYAPTLPGLPDQHEKWMHERFLAAGVAVVGIDVGESYGSPQGRDAFDALYKELTKRRGFAPKPCLLGRSRGGLMILSWAVENPVRVAGIVGIYPVLDFRTYPGLDKAAPAYGMTPQELERRIVDFDPIERVAPLAKARVPVFLIHGDVDTVVPLKENSAELLRRYEAAGAKDSVKLVIAQGQGHNAWEGFFRSQELVDFAIERARAGSQRDSK